MESPLLKKVWIYKSAKEPTQSGQYNTDVWVLEYAVESPKSIDPIMGWIGSESTEDHHKLFFESVDSAKRFAEREGLNYEVVPHVASIQPPKSYNDNFFGNLGKL